MPTRGPLGPLIWLASNSDYHLFCEYIHITVAQVLSLVFFVVPCQLDSRGNNELITKEADNDRVDLIVYLSDLEDELYVASPLTDISVSGLGVPFYVIDWLGICVCS